MGLPVTEQAATGREPERIGNRSPHHAPHNVFRCRGEDAWCAVAVLDDAQWRALTGVIGRPDLGRDTGLATAAGRLARVDELEAAVGAWTAEHSPNETMRLFQEARVPAGVVADSKTLIEDDAQLHDRGYWQHLDHPEMGRTTFTSPPYRLDGERVELARPPLIGEHTDALLGSILNYSEEQIAALRASGAIER
jgi:benzylsuccinate CoA-transferase BbsF subunit